MECSDLAVRTKDGGALAEPDFFQQRLAAVAGLTSPTVNQQLLCEVAWLAIAADKVAQCCTTALNGAPQDFFDLLHQQATLIHRQRLPGSQRMYSCRKQRFIGVDIADTDNKMAIHDQGFDGLFAVFQLAVQVSGREIPAEWFRSKTSQ